MRRANWCASSVKRSCTHTPATGLASAFTPRPAGSIASAPGPTAPAGARPPVLGAFLASPAAGPPGSLLFLALAGARPPVSSPGLAASTAVIGGGRDAGTPEGTVAYNSGAASQRGVTAGPPGPWA